MLFVTMDGANNVIEAVDGMKAGQPRAIVRALNRSIGAARTVMTRSVASDTGLKQADIRTALTMVTATPARPLASLAAGLDRMALIDFKAAGPEPSRGQGGGVTYKLQGGKNRIDSAFIATMTSGHRGVFARTPGKFMQYQKPTWKKQRQAIHELFGPSLGHVFLKYQGDAIARAEEVFVSRFEHEMTEQFNGTPVPSSDGSDDADAE